MRLRAPVPDDAPAVLELLIARDLVDLGVVDYTLDDLLDEWRASAFDLGTDSIIAEADADDAKIIAYATVWRPGARAVFIRARRNDAQVTDRHARAAGRACAHPQPPPTEDAR